MEQKEQLGLKATWKVTATKAGTRKLGDYTELTCSAEGSLFKGKPIIEEGEIVYQTSGRNMIVTTGLRFVSNMLIDTSALYDTGLTYCAEGTSDIAVATSQTTLQAEKARKAVTSRTISGVESTFSTFFTATEADDYIREAGIYGGTAAGTTINSGILFSRWLSSFNNSGTAFDVTIDWILTPAYA